VFQNIDINDGNVMCGFSEADARAFLREFEREKALNR
jgi:hypothetical protein